MNEEDLIKAKRKENIDVIWLSILLICPLIIILLLIHLKLMKQISELEAFGDFIIFSVEVVVL
ncbi:MAG: hypothetical protein NE327_07425, partial [Lentisphaeraceae bacterium]|nr:hypothetical protein [Lentisphaeraceae bacterium]